MISRRDATPWEVSDELTGSQLLSLAIYLQANSEGVGASIFTCVDYLLPQ